MARPLMVGDRVKSVKWRDAGWTAEVGYIGEVVGHDEGTNLYQIKLIRPGPDIHGWKRGEVYNERREDLVEI